MMIWQHTCSGVLEPKDLDEEETTRRCADTHALPAVGNGRDVLVFHASEKRRKVKPKYFEGWMTSWKAAVGGGFVLYHHTPVRTFGGLTPSLCRLLFESDASSSMNP